MNQNATEAATKAAVNTDAPVMTFDKIMHDFGTIKKESVQTVFLSPALEIRTIIVDARELWMYGTWLS